MAGRVLLVIGLGDKCSDVPGGGRLPENWVSTRWEQAKRSPAETAFCRCRSRDSAQLKREIRDCATTAPVRKQESRVDFQVALNQAQADDIVYCDPPYVPLSETASFTAYAKGGFDLDDQNRLAQAAQQTSEQSQGVLISNHDTEFTRSIYRDARLKTVMVQRNIAAKGSSRQRVGELLAIYGK